MATLAFPADRTPVERGFLNLGHFQPAGRSLRVTSSCLELDGRPWLPVMGEFHYSRYPEREWDEELRKLRAGGIDIVASYVIWNHHEASPGAFDWRGRRDLRRFVALAQEAGLQFYLRPGPWVHAEVRHGGLPDWLVRTQARVRCNDPGYLACVRRFYGEIGAQLAGLMWRDGGPVIGVQLENEYDQVGPGAGAEHIAELKRLAIEAGLAVPLYTVTGWPTLDIPPREVVPVSGAYADGFWSGDTGVLPPSGVFQFNTRRAIGEMGNVSGVAAWQRIDKHHYPFFLAEAGGGMHVSYHRRPAVSADDVAATCLVQLGNGAALYGYYMYHGGTNPPGPARLHESQDTGYPNDVPVLGYDFRAPLGQYGQARASYGRLRALHLFIASHGAELATFDSSLPEEASDDPADRRRLRVALRGCGDRGFLFVNNHVRHHAMPAFRGRVEVRAGARTLTVPSRDVQIADGACFIWPIGQSLGAARLRHATVQPLTRFDAPGACTWVGFATPGIAPELCFERETVRSIDVPDAWIERVDDVVLVRPDERALPCWIPVEDAEGGRHAVLLLDRARAEQASRLPLAGRERLVLSQHVAHVDAQGRLAVSLREGERERVRVFPSDDLRGLPVHDGFGTIDIEAPAAGVAAVRSRVLREQPRPPALRMGPYVAWRGRSVPLAPADEAYDQATCVALAVDAPRPVAGDRVMMEIDYLGDAARLLVDGELVDDHFHDGDPWQVGIDRFAGKDAWPVFELRILAADPAAPIFREPEAARRIAEAGGGARLERVDIAVWRTVRVELPKEGACHG